MQAGLLIVYRIPKKTSHRGWWSTSTATDAEVRQLTLKYRRLALKYGSCRMSTWLPKNVVRLRSWNAQTTTAGIAVDCWFCNLRATSPGIRRGSKRQRVCVDECHDRQPGRRLRRVRFRGALQARGLSTDKRVAGRVEESEVSRATGRCGEWHRGRDVGRLRTRSSQGVCLVFALQPRFASRSEDSTSGRHRPRLLPSGPMRASLHVGRALPSHDTGVVAEPGTESG